MSRSTVEPVLRLEADAWRLTTPTGSRRQPLEGVPAMQLERLEADGAGRGARLRVVLGDGWLRYLVLRWPQGVRSREERHAYLTHRFREVHEVAAPEWALSLDRDAVSAPVLACAAPAALVAAVEAFAAGRRLRLDGVTGDFIDCFNRLQRRFREPAGCFGALALARAGRVTVGLWRDGAWQALRSQPLGDNGPVQVRRMLETWCLEAEQREGAAAGGVLYACGLAATPPAGWGVERFGEGEWA